MRVKILPITLFSLLTGIFGCLGPDTVLPISERQTPSSSTDGMLPGKPTTSAGSPSSGSQSLGASTSFAAVTRTSSLTMSRISSGQKYMMSDPFMEIGADSIITATERGWGGSDLSQIAMLKHLTDISEPENDNGHSKNNDSGSTAEEGAGD